MFAFRVHIYNSTTITHVSRHDTTYARAPFPEWLDLHETSEQSPEGTARVPVSEAWFWQAA